MPHAFHPCIARQGRRRAGGRRVHTQESHLHLQALIDDALEAVVAARTAGGNCVRAAPVERSRLDGLGSLSPVQPQRRARKP